MSKNQERRAWNERLKRELRARGWTIWKTITIGGMDKERLLDEIYSGGFKVGEFVEGMMAQKEFTTEPEPRRIDLVRIPLSNLGRTKCCSEARIWALARERDLELPGRVVRVSGGSTRTSRNTRLSG